MAIQPASVDLKGGDSQAFTSDVPDVTWERGGVKGFTDLSDACIYVAPPKWRVWFSRQIALLAKKDGKSAGSAIIRVSSGPSWTLTLGAVYVALFFLLVVAVYIAWPPSPAVPWLDVDPPVVTLLPGANQQFDAKIWRSRGQGVTWSASDGSITPNGLFTAPLNGKRVLVTATSTADTGLTRSALVILNSPTLALQPASATLGPSGVVPLRWIEYLAATSGATTPASTISDFVWSSSSPDLKLNALDGTMQAQAPNKIKSFERVIVTATAKDQTRQAAAVIYLDPSGISPAETLSDQELQRDKRLIALVLLMGALGALLGASRSLANFVGNDSFVPRWTMFYLFRPIFGAGLAIIVFFGYRIGAVKAVTGVAPADPFAATFIAGMVGLFADTVLQKLKDLISAVFPTQDERKDKVTLSAAASPVIESVQAFAGKTMTIKGRNFVNGASVSLNGSPRETRFVSSSELSVTLLATDAAGDAKVVVTNPDHHASVEFAAKISP